MRHETTATRAHTVAVHTPRNVREAQARDGDLAPLRRAQQYGTHPAASRGWEPFIPGLGYVY